LAQQAPGNHFGSTVCSRADCNQGLGQIFDGDNIIH